MLEVIVVLVVMGITSVLVVPGVGKILGRYRLKVAARELSNFMLETRTEAVKNAGSINLDAETHRFYRVTFDKTKNQYFRQTLQQAFSNGSWANTTEWVLDGEAKTLPYNISISNVVNANEGTASQAGPAAGYYYRPDGTLVMDKTQDITVGQPPVTINVGIPENGFEDYSTVVSKIQLLSTKGDKYQVTVYSATGLTDIQEGWQ